MSNAWWGMGVGIDVSIKASPSHPLPVSTPSHNNGLFSCYVPQVNNEIWNISTIFFWTVKYARTMTDFQFMVFCFHFSWFVAVAFCCTKFGNSGERLFAFLFVFTFTFFSRRWSKSEQGRSTAHELVATEKKSWGNRLHILRNEFAPW